MALPDLGPPSPESNRDQYVEVFLRAWLCAMSPLTVGQMEKALDSLGRPARHVILKAGGLEAFIERTPELVIEKGSIRPTPVSTTSQPPQERLCAQMNKFTGSELETLNRGLDRLQLEPKTGAIVSALQKRGQLDELRRRCHQKKMSLESAKEHLAELQMASHQKTRPKRLEELTRRRDQLKARVDKGAAALKTKRALDGEMVRVDARIEKTEDHLKKLKLKITMAEERLVTMRQDLSFESKQSQALADKLLKQYDEDTERTVRVVDAIVQETRCHTRAIIDQHVSAVQRLLSSGDVRSEGQEVALDRLLQRLERLGGSGDVKEVDRELLLKTELTQFSQLGVYRLQDFRDPTQPDSRRSVLFPPLVRDTFFQSTHEASVEVALPSIPEIDYNCPICLEDIQAEASETLSCSHRFHSSCLDEMGSSGHTTCPLCRSYAPSSTDFPSLYKTNP